MNHANSFLFALVHGGLSFPLFCFFCSFSQIFHKRPYELLFHFFIYTPTFLGVLDFSFPSMSTLGHRYLMLFAIPFDVGHFCCWLLCHLLFLPLPMMATCFVLLVFCLFLPLFPPFVGIPPFHRPILGFEIFGRVFFYFCN